MRGLCAWIEQVLKRLHLNMLVISFFFFFNHTATTVLYTSLHTLSLHDALPICSWTHRGRHPRLHHQRNIQRGPNLSVDRKSTRLNSSHVTTSRMPSSA